MLHSIGHSSAPFEVLLNRLQQHDIQILVDVRKRPYSRYCPWYNQKNVIAELAKVGIEYDFAGDILGGTEYHETDMPAFHQRLKQITKRSQTRNVAMMCSENTPYPTKYTPSGCHRWWKLTQYILEYFPDRAVMHIMMDGSLNSTRPEEFAEQEIDWNGDPLGTKQTLF